jgi:thymidylate synthase (FAD)
MMKIDVLDHGYVQFIEAWGVGTEGDIGEDPDHWDYEVGIIEAARQSTQGNFRGWENDLKLLRYLYENQHSTPFEFAGMVIEVQAPLFVFREWQRHRTQSYNEMSARYTALPDLYYHCHVDDVIARAQTVTTNKQAQGAGTVDKAAITDWVANDLEIQRRLENHYKAGIRIGVPKELARKKMPVDHYSKMRASANLRNWLAFMTLRCAPNAQYEIRVFADAVAHIVGEVFPHTFHLWAKQTFGDLDD